MKKQVFIYGSILGVVQVLIVWLFFSMGIDALIGPIKGTIAGLIYIVLMVVLGIRFRRNLGGYMSFKDGFINLFIIMAISGFLCLVNDILLFNVIYPEIPPIVHEQLLEKTEASLGIISSSDEFIEDTMRQIEEAGPQLYTVPLINSYFSSLLIYLLGASIYALILKKNPPVFPENTSENTSHA